MKVLHDIDIQGRYTGDDHRGIIVGGRVFLPNRVVAASIDEATFLKLMKVHNSESSWFKIHRHNYSAFLRSRGRLELEKVKEDEDAIDMSNAHRENVESPSEPTPPGEVEVPEEPETPSDGEGVSEDESEKETLETKMAAHARSTDRNYSEMSDEEIEALTVSELRDILGSDDRVNSRTNKPALVSIFKETFKA